jgi:hypothetical protein
MGAIPDYVTQARQTAENEGQALQGMAGKEYTIADELKKVLNDVTTPGKQDWSGIRGKALSDYLAAPDIARSMYMNPNSPQNIFDPIQANRVMTEYTQGSEIPFFTANDLYSKMVSGEKGIIEAGTNAYKSQVAAKQAAYNAARQTYEDVFKEYTTIEDMRRADEQLALDKQKAAQTGGRQARFETMQLGDKIYKVNLDTNEKIELGPAAETKINPVTNLANQAQLLTDSGFEFNLDTSGDPKEWKISDVAPAADTRGIVSKGWDWLFGGGD